MMPGTHLGRVAMTPTEIKSAVNLRRLLTDNADIIQRITIAPSCSSASSLSAAAAGDAE